MAMSESLEKITFGDKEIYLIKTAHVSKTSVEDVDKAIEEISAQIKANPSKTFSSYLMRRNNNITYSISVLDPKNLQNLEYADCFQRITDWKKEVQSMMENLHASYIDFMQIGYCSL